MEPLNGYRIRLVLVGMAAAIVLGGGRAKADFTFGEPINLGPLVNFAGNDGSASLSADGLSLFYESDYPDRGYWNLFVVTRETIDDPWCDRIKLGSNVNNPNLNDWNPSISADGLELYFGRGDPGKGIQYDLYVTSRETTTGAWCMATSLGEMVNTTAREDDPAISSDSLSLYFSSNRPGGQGGTDLWVTTRPTKQDAWSNPVNLGSTINSSNDDFAPTITPDGLTLIFSSKRPGMYSSYADLWMTKRRTSADSWGKPINLGPFINTDDLDYADISPDGRTLYLSCYERARGYGRYDLWQAQIIPIVDFDGDGNVDALDLSIMANHWGENYSLCDIGPTPFGDCVVDVEDLKVLSKYLLENYPLAAYWMLDETDGDIASDSAGENDGMCLGELLWVPDGGKAGGALQFDGMDDYVSTPFVLDPAKGSLSAFAWIQGGGPGQVILSQTGDFGGMWLGFNPSKGTLMTGFSDIYFGVLESEATVAGRQWHHVGLVYDLNTLHRRLYVDGALVAEDTTVVSGVPSNGGLYIGVGKDLDATTFFSGLIDDVRIYNTILTPEQIERLAQ